VLLGSWEPGDEVHELLGSACESGAVVLAALGEELGVTMLLVGGLAGMPDPEGVVIEVLSFV